MKSPSRLGFFNKGSYFVTNEDSMGFLKKLLAVLLTFINLIAFKIYENEILEDSLVNNIPIVEGFQFRWLNIKAILLLN